MSVASAQQYPAGVDAALSNYAIDYLVSTLVPSLVKKFSNIAVPPVSGNKDGFDYSLDNIVCSGLTVGGQSAGLSPPSGLSAGLSGVGLGCTADWSFKLSSWPHQPSGSGSADVSISSSSMAIEVNLGAASLRPTISCGSASLDIANLQITLHGSAWDWLLDLFKGLLESSIRGALNDQVPGIIRSLVDTDGSKFLASIPIAEPIAVRPPYNISEARFGFTAPPLTSGGVLGLTVQGDVMPLGSAAVAPVPPPSLPPPSADPSGYMVLGRLTPYTLTTAAWTYLSASLLHWAIPPSQVPLGLNATGAYAPLIAPGLPAAYPGGTVSLALAVAALPAVTISTDAQGGIAALAPLQLDFLVQPRGANASSAPVLAFSLGVAARLSMDMQVAASSTAAGVLVFSGTLNYVSAK